MTIGSRQFQLMAVHRIQSLSLRIAVMSLDRGILKSRSRYVSLTSWTPSDLVVAWIYMYFPMFAPPVRAGARLCKPYIQRFAMLGHKTENKLIDLRIRLDTMTADEVRLTPYRSDEISYAPRDVQMPTIAPIILQVLLDMVARELDRDDIDDATKVSSASDMIKRYHQTRR
ncbi:hypothetical protein M9H77_09504 [Catharanthus roseus]|uniref:Uncharacterized protein n=1 Tax=Catharanthus roseus TaxID=4058 RepID=A0ACC0C147_CATRO|nr:hypothetical protein M9H77_09504 [Catharanthus roseus]